MRRRKALTRREFLGTAAGLGAFVLAPVACRDREATPPAGSPTKEEMPPMDSPTPTPTQAAPAAYFPPMAGDAWEAVVPSAVGWDTAAIGQAAEWAGAHKTTGVVLLHGGRIMFEGYWNGGSLHSQGDIASAQKSVTSLLVGIAQERGLLKLEDPVSKHLGEGWSKAGAKEAAITVRHLVTMSSGLDDQFGYLADAGTAWYYNNNAYHLSKRVLERATKTTNQAFMAEALLERTGMRDSAWRERPAMTMPDGVPMTGLMMSARDMARFGLLALCGADWAGKPVLGDKAYWRESISTSQKLNLSYGYLWWLNGKASNILPGPNPVVRQGPLIPGAPADLFAAMGAGDNRIYVVPGLDLVVVRQGGVAFEAAAARSSFDVEFWKLLMAAAPKGS